MSPSPLLSKKETETYAGLEIWATWLNYSYRAETWVHVLPFPDSNAHKGPFPEMTVFTGALEMTPPLWFYQFRLQKCWSEREMLHLKLPFSSWNMGCSPIQLLKEKWTKWFLKWSWNCLYIPGSVLASYVHVCSISFRTFWSINDVSIIPDDYLMKISTKRI